MRCGYDDDIAAGSFTRANPRRRVLEDEAFFGRAV